MSNRYLGIDVGTSGCRAIVIDAQERPIAEASVTMPAPLRDGARVEQWPEVWWQALCSVLDELAMNHPLEDIAAVALDATSGTVLLCDEACRPVAPALMYNDARAQRQSERIATIGARESAAHGATCGLAKALWLRQHHDAANAHRLFHQADWLNWMLTGVAGVTDANNALKTGYDAIQRCWPRWLDELDMPRAWLPQVVEPGTPLGVVSAVAARLSGLRAGTPVVAGTTDSTAAVYATGAAATGDAVTSLGSTLVMKVLSENPLFSPEHGVYSQPFGELWLVGGGSNSGGAVLRHFFDDAAMARMTPDLRPDAPTGLDYYPLLAPGERFPIANPNLAPRLEPRPADDITFFQGLLEGMARIERDAYRLLETLGAPYPRRIISTGGGARNAAWCKIRERMLKIRVETATHDQAAYGTALIAKRALTR